MEVKDAVYNRQESTLRGAARVVDDREVCGYELSTDNDGEWLFSTKVVSVDE